MRFPLAAALIIAASAPLAAQTPRTSSTILSLPPIAPPTGSEVFPLDQCLPNLPCVPPNVITGSMTLNALGAFLAGKILPLDITLSGQTFIPAGPHHVSAAPGSTLTLPLGAPVGTIEEVDDYTGGAGTAPISVTAPFDATILEQSPYLLTVPFEVMGFRKLPSGAWHAYVEHNAPLAARQLPPFAGGDVGSVGGTTALTIFPSAVTSGKLAPGAAVGNGAAAAGANSDITSLGGIKAAGAPVALDLGTREATLGYISTDFGVKCDGTTNDTTAMQTLINAGASLGVQLELVPRGKICLANIKTATNLHARIDGTLLTATLGQDLIKNGSATDSNIVIEGDGILDNGYPVAATAPSASAPVGCFDTLGPISNWTVRGLTLQNCGNWPVNIVGNSSSQTGGAAHIFFSYVKAIGGGNRNSWEYADGCDDCRADNITISGLAGDIDFAFYGPNSNGAVTNSHFYGGAFGVAVLADGTAGQSLNSYPSSNILIQGNEISGTLNGAIEVHGASLAASSYHHAIRIIGNDGHGNNTTGATYGGAYAGGETIIECDGCYSSGNFWHEDGAGGSNTAPIAGVSLFAASKNFTSVGDTVYDEGSNGGQGVGAAIATGATKPAFYAFRAYDNQSASTMVQAIAGSCAADCTIIGSKTSGFSNPWGGLTINASASYMQNDLSPYNYFAGNLYPVNISASGVLAANGAASQIQLGSQAAPGTPASLVYSSGSATQDYTVQYSGGTSGTANKGVAVYNGAQHIFNGLMVVQGPLQEALSTPSSSAAACSPGQMQDDASYHYVCTASNTWKRVALSPF